MKFVEIKLLNIANPEQALNIGAILPDVAPDNLFDDASQVRAFVSRCVNKDGSWTVQDSAGVTRYFGAAVMASSVLEARLINLPEEAASDAPSIASA